MVSGTPQKFICSYSEARLIHRTESLRQTGISELIKTELGLFLAQLWKGAGKTFV